MPPLTTPQSGPAGAIDRLRGAWPRVLAAAAWGWTLAIFVFLWMPPPPPPEIVWPWWDSLVHTGLLAGFGGLWTWRGLGTARVLGLGAALGAVTELGQALLPWERSCSWDDFAFDLLGVTLGWIVAGGPWRRRSKRAITRSKSPRSAHSRCEAAAVLDRSLE